MAASARCNVVVKATSVTYVRFVYPRGIFVTDRWISSIAREFWISWTFETVSNLSFPREAPHVASPARTKLGSLDF